MPEEEVNECSCEHKNTNDDTEELDYDVGTKIEMLVRVVCVDCKHILGYKNQVYLLDHEEEAKE